MALTKSINGQAIQGFVSHEIVSVTGGSFLDVSDTVAVRVAYPSDYKINDTGTVGTMSGVTVIASGVTKLGFEDTTVVEVMK
jgi:MFS superfamily sulfate permease-like transporter